MNVGARVVEVVMRDAAASRASDALVAAGGEVYAVGGVVRDVALGVEPNDVDLMVRLMTREQVRVALELLPGRVSEVGKSFGILEYRCHEGCVQVALPRKDRFIGVHHTDVAVDVDPEMSVKDDLSRRDFTVNAVAVRVPSGEVIDPMHGLNDAEVRVVRAVNTDVLVDDPLRVVRAIVLFAKRNLWIHGHTAEMLRKNAHAVENLPADRLHDELDKLMACARPSGGIKLAQRLEVLERVLPEVSAMYQYDQRSKYHKRDLFDHTLVVLEYASHYTSDRDVRLAALLHDVGKPNSAWTDEDGYNHYYMNRIEDPDSGWTLELGADHEIVGAEMVHALMSRLRYSVTRINRVTGLVRHHMFPYFDTPKGARRFLARTGDLADDLLTLRRSDDEGSEDVRHFRMRELVEQVRSEENAISVRDLEIDGHDLIELGIPAGPVRGILLRSLLDRVVDEPALNRRDDLLGLVESYRDDSWGLRARQGDPQT